MFTNPFDATFMQHLCWPHEHSGEEVGNPHNDGDDAELCDWLASLHSDDEAIVFANKATTIGLEAPSIDEESSENRAWKPRLTSMRPKIPNTVIEILHRYIVRQPDGTIDCSGITSRKCYEDWLSTRKKLKTSNPEESFRKAILAHLTSADKASAPFEEDVEVAILKHLRQKKIWECFAGQKDPRTGKKLTIGVLGLRCQGYHEKQKLLWAKSKRDLDMDALDSPKRIKVEYQF